MYEKSGGVDLGALVGENRGNLLVFDDRSTECFAGERVLECCFVSGTGDTDGLCGDERTGCFEGLHRSLTGAVLAGAGSFDATFVAFQVTEECVERNADVLEV